jgi:DNA-binding NarL/FixJ family response regulator
MDNKIAVFLVASNRLLREALTRLLEKKTQFQVSRVASTMPELSSILDPKPDVLILDSVTMHASGALQLISNLHQLSPAVNIALIDMENDPDLFLECIRAGVRGYLLRDASAAEVVEGVRAVTQGQATCPPQLCLTLFQSVADEWKDRPTFRIRVCHGLTRRQQELVPLISRGWTNKEIASHLNLSAQTVKNHVHRMLQRVGAHDRLAIADKVHGNGNFAYE